MEFNATNFFNDLFGTLHVLTDESGEIWFIGREVTEKLGYVDSSTQGHAIKKFVREEDRKALKYKALSAANKAILWLNPNDFSDKWIINECGFYDLLMHSEAKLASDFQHWVTHDVLPSIRKNGGYILGQEDLEEEQQEVLMKKIRDLKAEVERLKNVNRKKTERIRKERYKAEINRLCREKYREALNDIDRMTKLFETEDKYVQYLIDRSFDQTIFHKVNDNKFLLLKMLLEDAGQGDLIQEMENLYAELETPKTAANTSVDIFGFVQPMHGTNVFLR